MRLLPSLLLVGASMVASATPAFAHFNLMEPTNYAVQDADGNPQKTAPCGPNGAFTATNYVTQVQTGGTIDIKIDETVMHPGHYRVSLAQSIDMLPADPPVNNPGACGSLDINPSPTLPLLADGLLVHTTSFAAPQTVTVQLPAGMTCTNCVLQVQEFMAQHGAPCFYHHCAMVTITDNPVNTPPDQLDAGVPPNGTDAGSNPNPPATDGGCSAGTGAGILIGLAGLGLRRRRRTPR